MRDLVQALEGDVNLLRQELELGPALEQALAGTGGISKVLLNQRTARSKRMAYVHGIVSIYGLLEQHVDLIVMEVAKSFEEICTHYSHLPDRLRSAHREFTLRAALDKDRVRLRETFNESTALSVLAAGVNDSPVRLNKSVFTYSTANYRHPHIVDLLRRVDVEVEDCSKVAQVSSAIQAQGLSFRDAEPLLFDLAQRRNEVAHSYQTSDLLDSSVLIGYLTVVAEYLKAAISEASQRLLQELAARHLTNIGKVVHAYTSSYGVDMIAGHIQCPCSILLVKGGRAGVLVAQSLQSEGGDLAGRVEYAAETIQLGIGFAGPVPSTWNNAEVFVLPDKWLHLRA